MPPIIELFEMRIFNLRSEESDDIVTLSATIESKKIGTKDVWFAIQKKYSDYLCTTRMDAFVVGLLYPAMQYGEDISVEGCVSKKLLFNINNYVIPLLMSYSDTAKKITVSAFDVSSEKFTGKGVGTGFSGGVDSFSTVYDLYENEVDPEMKINTFLFLNVGSHGTNPETSKTLFEKRYSLLEGFPKEVGLDFIPLDSNLHQFHPWGHERVHTLTGVAGVLAMQNYFSKYYYSSSGLDYEGIIKNAHKYKGKAIGSFCDPILLPLLSTETTEFILHGAAQTRVDKILNISSYEPTFRYLNVCVRETENCSVCWKCLRTQLALDFSGNLDNYSSLFDKGKYKKLKPGYIYQQVATKNSDPLSREIIKLADKNHIKLPGYFTSYSHFLLHYNYKNDIKKTIKTIAPNMVDKLKR